MAASENNLLCWLTAFESLARVTIVIKTSSEPGRAKPFLGQQVLKIDKAYSISGSRLGGPGEPNVLIGWANFVRKQINRPNPKRDRGTNCPQFLPKRSPLSAAVSSAYVYTTDFWIEDYGLLRSLLPGYLSEAGINPGMAGSFVERLDSIVLKILSEIRRASQ